MKKNNLTYSNAIEQVMLHNGYFAPLKLIYKNIWLFKDRSSVKGVTPNYTIQEKVQRDKRFTRIGLGVYALTDYLNKLSATTFDVSTKERKHASIQGMLLEIGNFRHEVENTYTNDKKWVFDNKTLGSLATLKSVPNFTYERIIKESITYIDVIWFNNRGFPQRVFEVEHSTDFRDAFVKFMELQDFNTELYIISDGDKKSKYEREKNKMAFRPIEGKIKFLTYDEVENDYLNIIKKTYI